MTLNASAWQFPKAHGVKAIGHTKDPVQTVFVNLIEQLNLKYDSTSITSKPSSSGKYVSITVTIHFEQAAQVEQLYAALHIEPTIVQSL